jgi:CBS domain-containing protein
MKTGYSAADAMTTKPIVVPSNITVRDAGKVMRDHDVGSLLVVDDGLLVGIITAEDIVHRVTAEGKKSAETLLKDVMTADIIDIGPEADLYDAMTIMQEHDILHLPVRDEQKRLLGFLTLKDILKIEPQLFEIMGEMAALTHPSELGKKEGYCAECGNYGDLRPKHGKLVCQYCGEE